MAASEEEFGRDTDFLGRGWSFPVRFSKSSKSVEMSQEEEDIRESLEILLGTVRGERVMRPDFGTNLHGKIFETLHSFSAAAMSEDIRRSILFHEPRVIPGEISFRQESGEGLILIILEYTVIATNTRTNMVYPFYLEEGTDINR